MQTQSVADNERGENSIQLWQGSEAFKLQENLSNKIIFPTAFKQISLKLIDSGRTQDSEQNHLF